MSTKIFIGNLSDDTESDDIRVLFEKYGTVEECDVLKNYGFVHMPTKSEASAAITNLNGYNIKGQRMRVELSTNKRGNPKGDRRGFDRDGERGGRPRPYPPGPPRRGPPPPPDFDRYDPYYRYPYPERDPYYRLPPVDRYMPRLPPLDDRYPPLPRERFPEERGYPPMDPRDRMMARERLARYPDEYDRLRAADRVPPPADPYYRDRSPPPSSRPPPEYYDRKAPLMRTPAASTAAAAPSTRLNTTAYPPANGYDYYRNPAETAERTSYGGAASTQSFKNGPAGASAGYDRGGVAQQPRTGPPQQQGAGGAGGYGMPQQAPQAQKRYDSQSAMQPYF